MLQFIQGDYIYKFILSYFNMIIGKQCRCTKESMDSFYKQILTLTSVWLSSHMPSEVWDEITYPFPNFNGGTFEVWEWISNFLPHFTGHVIIYPCWMYFSYQYLLRITYQSSILDEGYSWHCRSSSKDLKVRHIQEMLIPSESSWYSQDHFV